MARKFVWFVYDLSICLQSEVQTSILSEVQEVALHPTQREVECGALHSILQEVEEGALHLIQKEVEFGAPHC